MDTRHRSKIPGITTITCISTDPILRVLARLPQINRNMREFRGFCTCSSARRKFNQVPFWLIWFSLQWRVVGGVTLSELIGFGTWVINIINHRPLANPSCFFAKNSVISSGCTGTETVTRYRGFQIFSHPCINEHFNRQYQQTHKH
jgi:hypothetical protein